MPSDNVYPYGLHILLEFEINHIILYHMGSKLKSASIELLHRPNIALSLLRCMQCSLITNQYLGLVARKPVFGVSDKASFKPVSSAKESS